MRNRFPHRWSVDFVKPLLHTRRPGRAARRTLKRAEELIDAVKLEHVTTQLEERIANEGVVERIASTERRMEDVQSNMDRLHQRAVAHEQVRLDNIGLRAERDGEIARLWDESRNQGSSIRLLLEKAGYEVPHEVQPQRSSMSVTEWWFKLVVALMYITVPVLILFLIVGQLPGAEAVQGRRVTWEDTAPKTMSARGAVFAAMGTSSQGPATSAFQSGPNWEEPRGAGAGDTMDCFLPAVAGHGSDDRGIGEDRFCL